MSLSSFFNKKLLKHTNNLVIEAACITHAGKSRDANEDNFYFRDSYLPMSHSSLIEPISAQIPSKKMSIFSVFGGMGQENLGSLASYIGAITIEKLYAETDFTNMSLYNAIRRMNSYVCSSAQSHPDAHMGTTMSTLIFFPDHVWTLNLGNNSIFLLRNTDLENIGLQQAASVAKSFLGTDGQTQFLGMDEMIVPISPSIMDVPLEKNDVFLMCTDGLTDVVSETEIQQILESDMSTKEMVNALLNKALEYGSTDHITLIICKIL